MKKSGNSLKTFKIQSIVSVFVNSLSIIVI